MLYTDGGIMFEEYGLNLVRHLYKRPAPAEQRQVETIYTSKDGGIAWRGRA